MLRLGATAVVVALGAVALDLSGTPAQAELPPKVVEPLPWMAPGWHPGGAELEVLEGMDAVGPRTGGPRLHSAAAFVYDLDAGETLYEKAADNRQPVASLTKMVSALAMASEDPDLDQVICVDPLLWPTRSGARSKLSTGECYRAWDLMGIALVASDNRGAYGMAVASGLDYFAFIRRMDRISAELRMDQSSWADPSGLEDENLSTARDMARAAVAVSLHPTLAVAATAPSWELVEEGEGRGRTLRTTDRLLAREDLEVLAAKTGYTDTAHYCFAAVVRLADGRRVALSVLGAPRSRDRWNDVAHILDWVEERP